MALPIIVKIHTIRQSDHNLTSLKFIRLIYLVIYKKLIAKSKIFFYHYLVLTYYNNNM